MISNEQNVTERFELKLNDNGQVDIIDWVESKEKNAICIYNDLGVLPFSSAKQLCGLLNELSDENVQLKEVINVADEIINWNTIPQIRRSWENFKNGRVDEDG